MIRTLLVALALLLTSLVCADPLAEANDLYSRANEAYEAQRYEEALELYERLAAGEYGTADVLANAGTAAWRTEDAGRAVLYYLRALRLDPGNERARENLAFVQPETNVVDGDSFFALLETWFASTPSLPWYVLFQAAFVLLVVAMTFAARSAPRTDVRADWLGRAGAGLMASIFFGTIVFLHGEARRPDGDAVVIRDKAVSRSGPATNYFEQLELPAGTVVTLKGAPRNGWVEFRLLDGSTGFLTTESVEPI